MTVTLTSWQAALAALETVLSALSGQDHYATAAPPLLAAIRQHRDLGASEAQVRHDSLMSRVDL